MVEHVTFNHGVPGSIPGGPTIDIHAATASYERWLGRQTTIVAADLRRKHRRMRESAFVFLRGTFYRWMQIWPAYCPDLDLAPRVLGAGDLHLENFGTWREAKGRLVWGINDVDEACDIPYTLDLVRLAVSAVLAIREGHLAISERAACAAILDGYAASIDRGGRPFVLADGAHWLTKAALSRLRNPKRYWKKLAAFPRATGRVPRQELRAQLPDPSLPFTVLHRIAGVGSLGRQRFVAIAHGDDGPVAREAKALLPSAAAWARGDTRPRIHVNELLTRAVRDADAFFVVSGRWMIRRLAPDCARIELEDLPKVRDEKKLLHAMGWETANLHLGSERRRIAQHLGRQKGRWLEHAAHAMAGATVDDWRAFRRSRATLS